MTRFSDIRDLLMRVPLAASQVPASQCNELAPALVMASLLIIGDRSRGRSQ